MSNELVEGVRLKAIHFVDAVNKGPVRSSDTCSLTVVEVQGNGQHVMVPWVLEKHLDGPDRLWNIAPLEGVEFETTEPHDRQDGRG